MWDLNTSNTRIGNSKQVEMILNDALKGLSVFDSNHVSHQRIVHFSPIAELVADIKKKPKNMAKSLPIWEIQHTFAFASSPMS